MKRAAKTILGLLLAAALLAYAAFSVLFAGWVVSYLVSCAGRPGPADIAAYTAEQQRCVADSSTRDAADACRAISRDRFCGRWPTEVNCAERTKP